MKKALESGVMKNLTPGFLAAKKIFQGPGDVRRFNRGKLSNVLIVSYHAPFGIFRFPFHL